MRWRVTALACALTVAAIFVCAGGAARTQGDIWEGTWETTRGTMTLTYDKTWLYGTFGTDGRIIGEVALNFPGDPVLSVYGGYYWFGGPLPAPVGPGNRGPIPPGAGRFQFSLQRPGLSFTGTYVEPGSTTPQTGWDGKRASGVPVIDDPTPDGVGDVLTATPGTWFGSPTFVYQWLRCNTSGESCVEITGATSVQYAVTAADVGKTLRVRVTAQYGATTLPPVVSAATAVVPGGGAKPLPPPPPPSRGTHPVAVTAAGPVTTRLVFNNGKGSYQPTSARVALTGKFGNVVGQRPGTVSGSTRVTLTMAKVRGQGPARTTTTLSYRIVKARRFTSTANGFRSVVLYGELKGGSPPQCRSAVLVVGDATGSQGKDGFSFTVCKIGRTWLGGVMLAGTAGQSVSTRIG